MFIVNGMKATLIRYNQNNDTNVYDDEPRVTKTIKCCPYDISQGIRFGIYSVPEAKGYYQVSRNLDVREGDQLIFLGKNTDNLVHTILNVQDNWIFNRVENKILAVK